MTRLVPSTRLVIVGLLIASFVTTDAFAQVTPGSPMVGPAGGVSSTTAPSNGEGTPAGGTGVLGTTRVGPSVSTPMAPVATAPTATTPRRRRVYRRRAVRHRAPTETGTQSQDGTNGSVPPATR